MTISRYEDHVSSSNNDYVYGPGIDGNITISNTGTPTVLTRDMYYENLTVNTSCVLITNGFRVFVKNNLIVDGTIGSTVGYTTQISSGTVSGQGTGINTYSLSQSSSDPVNLNILNDLQTAISASYIDNSGTVRILTGGDKGSDGANGSDGSDGTGATSAPLTWPGKSGNPGNAGTGANPGGANPGGGAGHNDSSTHGYSHNPGVSHAYNGGHGAHHHAHGFNAMHSPYASNHQPGHHHSYGHSGNAGTAGNAGTNGAGGPAGGDGNVGSDGTNGSKGIGGTGGAGGRGGPVVIIAAKNISGSGLIINVGQNGSAGSAGNSGNIGSDGNPGNPGNPAPSTWPGKDGSSGSGGSNGTAGNAVAGIVNAEVQVGSWHYPYSWHYGGAHNPAYHYHNASPRYSYMRTYGGTPGRPANESNAAHFPHRATRYSTEHAFHWSGGASNRAWPRGANPAYIAHFLIAIDIYAPAHYTPASNPHANKVGNAHGHTYTHGANSGHGGSAGTGHAGTAGNPGNAGNAGTGGPNGLAGNPGNPGNAGDTGSVGKEGGIIIVTDSWGLSQSLSSSTKVILNT